jgi:hypothetical protein
MRTETLDDILRRIPQAARNYVAANMARGLVAKREPYYSKIRFEPTITNNTTNVVYAFTAGQRSRCFDYGLGASMVTAGFTSAGAYANATLADTNLQSGAGRETNGSDMMVIDSVAFLPTPKSDPVLLKAIIAELTVTAGFGGSVSDYKMGNPLFLPGGGGLFGGGTSKLADALSTNDSGTTVPSFVTNGLPGAGDLLLLEDPIVWMPKPEADSQFAMEITCQRAITVTANARTAGAGGINPAAVVPPVTPGADGTFVEFLVRLVGTQIGPRSRSR